VCRPKGLASGSAGPLLLLLIFAGTAKPARTVAFLVEGEVIGPDIFGISKNTG
jgi:hypothetical protein